MISTEEILSPLLKLQQSINAPQVEHELIAIPKPAFTIDIDYSNAEKVKAANIILHNSSGLFTIDKYSGIFLLYIPFIEGFKKYGSLPRFHFKPCGTVRNMEKYEKLHRFRLTSDTSGKFLMSDGSVHELDVCQNCLRSWKYPEPFSIARLVERTEGNLPKKYVDRVKMGVILPDEYPANWQAISNVMRELNHWRCSLCGVNLHDRPDLLHVHHRNCIKTDTRPENLQVLCVLCHNKIHHETIYVSDEDRKYIERLRAERRNTKFQRS